MRAFGLIVALVISTATAAAPPAVEITHGPILGRPGATTMGVWARTSAPGRFAVAYWAEGEPPYQLSAPVVTTLASDDTGWVLLEGLRPGTLYHYGVIPEGATTGPTGTFRTLPRADEFDDPAHNPHGLFNFSFEYACGNLQAPGFGMGPELPTYRTMNRQIRDEISFAILNGDWLYEERRGYPIEAWQRQVGIASEDTPRRVALAPTIVGVWENYKLYLDRGRPLAEWHRHVPSYFVIDDHEILNDVWGTGEPGLRDRRSVFRDIGTQAWYDYLAWSNPVAFDQGIVFSRALLEAGSTTLKDPEADFSTLDLAQAATLHIHWGTPTAGVNEVALDGVDGDPNAGVYRIVRVIDDHHLEIDPPADTDGEATYSIGRRSYYRFRVANAEFFVLDTRSHREVPDLERPDEPGVSMLGDEQRRWLFEGVRSSGADVLFVVSSVNFTVPHTGGVNARAAKDEAWTAFLDEREQLISLFDGLGKKVFILTGDLHNSFVVKITENVWEMASGPHNSLNHRLNEEAGRPINGVFRSGPRECEIRWSTAFLPDVPRHELRQPVFTVVQINNVLNNPTDGGTSRWVAYPQPQVVFRFHDGVTGRLLYAEGILF
jgi:phosphodiesterase/alkaline phosphatase D-like protein